MDTIIIGFMLWIALSFFLAFLWSRAFGHRDR